MIQTIDFYDFRDAFKRYGRSDQFSHEGLKLIFDYIEDYERDSGEQVEFDMIGLCCEWAEEDAATLAQYYDFDSAALDDVVEAMQDATQVAGVTSNGTVVYVQF